MTNKNILLAILITFVVGVGVYALVGQTANSPKTRGKIVFGITDAAENMGSVSAVLVTVNKVEIHSDVDGWVTISNDTKEYDLLALKQSGTVLLLASGSVSAGTYNQVRLMVSKVIVVKNGVKTEAKLPSSELKIVGNIIVNGDKTSSVIFDFIADKSLHITGNGKIIFAPVIMIKKRSETNIEIKSNDEIKITGGKEENDEESGMDEKGEFRNNFELKGKLHIDENDDVRGESNDDGKSESKEEAKADLTFILNAQNNSGFSGTATVSEEGGFAKVTLKLKNDVLGLLSFAEPAHIHFGSCANIGGVKYPLNSVVEGKSVTVLHVSFADLKSELPLSINVHKSVAESNIYIACTDLSF